METKHLVKSLEGVTPNGPLKIRSHRLASMKDYPVKETIAPSCILCPHFMIID